MEILTTVAIMSGIGVFLAAVLVVADRYLNAYGECTITINEGTKELKVNGGSSLLTTLMENEIFIPSACGGRGSCGLCKIQVTAGAGPLLPTEVPYLTPEEIQEGVRLACQVKVREDLEVTIPEELFSIREYVATVTSIRDLTHDIKGLRIRLPEGEAIHFRAGQYVQIRTPLYGNVEEEVYRAYSLASSEKVHDEIELIIRRVPHGICTTYVFDYLKEGDPIVFNGPYGDFYLRDTDKEIIFMAGGSGLAPIKSMLYKMREDGIERKATFFFGCVAKRDLYHLEEMMQLEKELADFRFIPALSNPRPEDEWDGETGLITEVVDRYIPERTDAEAYLCGSPGMIDACLEVLHRKGIGDDSIFFDKFWLLEVVR
ncbi:MAG: NADH:ubiquinone reductase (Na(+)-transporting) subunit F [Clostridia bacterium]|jgi:Na+-transporting NADH:ubiquinone oxidoreductase subunit F